MGIEGSRPAWVKRFHGESLRGPKMMYGVEKGCLVVEKFGRRRFADLEDGEEMRRILTNDMELNEEVAEEIMRLASEAAVAGGEVF